MITYLTGTIAERTERMLVIEVDGVGYRVHINTSTAGAFSPGTKATVYTHLVSKEDSLELYGFATRAEEQLFGMLIDVSGVGPRTALSILTLAPPETLKSAIAAGDTSYLTTVSGIGKKNAEKIVLELKEKFESETGAHGYGYNAEDSEVLEALTALGYSTQEAREALSYVSAETTSTNDRIKEALRHLGS